MVIGIIVVSHVIVGAVCYLIGADRMKKNIERELIRVLEEHKPKQ